MRHAMLVTAVLAGATVGPATARAEGDVRLSAGGGLMFGGNVRYGFGEVGQGNAGLLAGVRAAWLPVTFSKFAFGPEAMAVRWTTEVDESSGTLALVGGRLTFLQGDIELYLSARGGMWIERLHGVLDSGFGGFTKVSSHFHIGWEVGAVTWRENNFEFYPKSGLVHEADVYKQFRFVGVHGFFEVAYTL